MKMKILPKALIVAAIIGGLGYGATLLKMPNKEVSPTPVVTNQLPAYQVPPIVLSPQRVDITPEHNVEQQKPMPKQELDIGMEKLLNQGNKK